MTSVLYFYSHSASYLSSMYHNRRRIKTAIRITSPDSYYFNGIQKLLQPELLYFLQPNFLQWIHILLLSPLNPIQSLLRHIIIACKNYFLRQGFLIYLFFRTDLLDPYGLTLSRKQIKIIIRQDHIRIRKFNFIT